MSCDFTHHDGSYVLGALSPAERRAFERHLADCAACARSVRELAGLPGLLGRVDADVLVSPPVPEPVPETLLPALAREVRRRRRRRAWTTGSLAAAAAVAVVAASLTADGVLSTDGDTPGAGPAPGPPTSVAAPTSVPEVMVPVGHPPVRASLAFTGVAWGTRLDLVCTYLPATGAYQPYDTTYSLVVRTRDGRVEQVATWRALPGHTMRLAGATSASRADIESVQVRTASGEPVLELTA